MVVEWNKDDPFLKRGKCFMVRSRYGGLKGLLLKHGKYLLFQVYRGFSGISNKITRGHFEVLERYIDDENSSKKYTESKINKISVLFVVQHWEITSKYFRSQKSANIILYF